MQTTTKIQVTQQDIDAGQRGRCATCPIAMAMSRVIDEAVLVELNAAVPDSFLTTGWYALPESAASFQRNYDDMKPVEPFEFEAVRMPPSGPKFA